MPKDNKRITGSSRPVMMHSIQKVGLLLVSAASLCFEINLTRLFSVSHFYHFAFMVVSIALFGFGASGTFLTVFRRKGRATLKRTLTWLAAAMSASILGSYILVNRIPFDSFSIMVDRRQILILALHYLALSTPFFFSGLIVSMLLTEYARNSGRVYALNLLGSALGCLAAVVLPRFVGGEGTVAFSSAAAGLGAITFAVESSSKGIKKAFPIILRLVVVIALVGISLVEMGLITFTGTGLKAMEITISPYKGISYAMQNPEAKIVSSRWNAFSRVEVVESPSMHSIPGLSYRYLDSLPPIKGAFVDGDNMNAILPPNADGVFSGYLPAAIAYDLRPDAKTLIVNAKGGTDVLTALALSAREVIAVEENDLLIQAAEEIYHLSDVKVVQSSARSFLRSGDEQFDIILMPLTDSYHPVSSGAFSLGENYDLTMEAFDDMLDRLQPGGILTITRWLQEQPSEWLRAFALAVASLEGQELRPDERIIALRGYNTGTILIKNGIFTSDEMEMVREFVEDKAFDLVFASDIQADDLNQRNILPEPVYHLTFMEVINAKGREKFFDAYKYDVRPPVDDHPFFGHYFRWSQIGEIWNALGTTWQPFGGAGFLVILILFGLALLLSGILIILPAAARGRESRERQAGGVRNLSYFGLIGLGFLLVEMPMIQQFILYIDHPTYAMAAVLFSLLLFSGIGSRWGSEKIPLSTAILILLVLLIGWVVLFPHLLYVTMGKPLLLRILISILSIAPIGILMGIPFPAGLRWARVSQSRLLDLDDTRYIGWIWAVNGTSSVVASILSSLVSLTYGFKLTMIVGMACYLGAWFMVTWSRQIQPLRR